MQDGIYNCFFFWNKRISYLWCITFLAIILNNSVIWLMLINYKRYIYISLNLEVIDDYQFLIYIQSCTWHRISAQNKILYLSILYRKFIFLCIEQNIIWLIDKEYRHRTRMVNKRKMRREYIHIWSFPLAKSLPFIIVILIASVILHGRKIQKNDKNPKKKRKNPEKKEKTQKINTSNFLSAINTERLYVYTITFYFNIDW